MSVTPRDPRASPDVRTELTQPHLDETMLAMSYSGQDCVDCGSRACEVRTCDTCDTLRVRVQSPLPHNPTEKRVSTPESLTSFLHVHFLLFNKSESLHKSLIDLIIKY